MKTVLASYVVRVYRFGKNQPHNLVGVVEEAGIKGKKAFTSLAELWGIIRSPRGVRNHSKAKRNKPVCSEKIQRKCFLTKGGDRLPGQRRNQS